MLFLKRYSLRIKLHNKRFQSTKAAAAVVELPNNNDEYNIHPYDNSIEARKLREKQAWFEEIKNLPTIEEKLIKINLPKYYGYKCTILSDQKFPYNCLDMSQHYTRTSFEETEKLPEFYKQNDELVSELSGKLKGDVVDSLEYATEIFRIKFGPNPNIEPEEKDKLFGEIVVQQLNRILINALNKEYPHLSETELDIEPRHEAFWWVGGVRPPKSIRKSREGLEYMKDKANDPVDRYVQYLGRPYLALRHRLPLQSVTNIINIDETNNVPVYEYDARSLGYTCAYRHGTTIPGYWPGSPEEFGIISYQKRNHMVMRRFGDLDNQESLHSQGIQSSYAWLFGQACYQGFSTFNDITYPLSTQNIITNGKLWSFYVYQLNTTLVHSKKFNENQRLNKCWGTKELKLFEEIDEKNKCIGFDENVLKNLIHFYINKPIERNVNLKPYLNVDERKIADIKSDQKREFLERVYKHMNSNRPRHLLVPEVYLWEKIYKIDNKTRPLDSKRRFFELNIDPFKRRMDEHTPEYVPKPIRPDGPKGKKRWKKTYYP